MAGQLLKIVTDYQLEGDVKQIACSYKSLPTTVSVGSTIYINDGALTCEVTEVHDVSNSTPYLIINLFCRITLSFFVRPAADLERREI